MGCELYENSPAARAVFELCENIRPGTIKQCFSGGSDELARTETTQPCLYCVDLAAAEALREAGVFAEMLAGFSLGEFAALAYSGAVSYEDGFRLVCKRAELMQKASDFIGAGMAAVLKLPDSSVSALCDEFYNVYPVNYNCDGQVVVAFAEGESEQFKLRVREAGGRVMPLKVSGGFHSPLIAGAPAEFDDVLDTFNYSQPELPLYSNVTARPYRGEAKGYLSKQICSPVQWRATVENMVLDGADTFIEVGPGKALSGLITRISDKARMFNVEDSESLERTISSIQHNS